MRRATSPHPRGASRDAACRASRTSCTSRVRSTCTTSEASSYSAWPTRLDETRRHGSHYTHRLEFLRASCCLVGGSESSDDSCLISSGQDVLSSMMSSQSPSTAVKGGSKDRGPVRQCARYKTSQGLSAQLAGWCNRSVQPVPSGS